jgi:hypothetical protein
VLALFKLAIVLEGGYARSSAAGARDQDNRVTTMMPCCFEKRPTSRKEIASERHE